jgi:hypothetical protein
MKRKIIAALAVAAMLTVPAAASANVPSYQNRADAKQTAYVYWENRGDYVTDVCPYGVELKFERFRHKPGVYGFVYMDDGYGNSSCTIHMNSGVQWNWSNLSYVVAHETGHVLGHYHQSKRSSIMYPAYPNPVYGTRFPTLVRYPYADGGGAVLRANGTVTDKDGVNHEGGYVGMDGLIRWPADTDNTDY